MLTVLIVLIAAVAGFVLGATVGGKNIEDKIIGNLKVVHADEDGPYLYLEISRTVEQIAQMNTVVLLIENQEVPQK